MNKALTISTKVIVYNVLYYPKKIVNKIQQGFGNK